ncbi:MAG TPA: tetratricopeptide repeat protein [Myxococcales bacterium]|nr:tetratricopeptide repeat protein [Myxococcales bacterium]
MKLLNQRSWPFWGFFLLGFVVPGTAMGAGESQKPSAPSAFALVDPAFEALKKGDWHRAGQLFEELNAEFPGEPEFLYCMGLAAASGGDDLHAVDAFAEAAALDPELDWVQADLGMSLYRLGEFALAEDHLLEALLQGPEDADVLLHLGLIDLENGNHERGLRMLEESVALDPEVAALAFYQAANYELDRDNLEGAMALLERAALAPGPEGWRVASARLLATLAQSEIALPRIRLRAVAGIENDDNLTVSQQDLTTGIGDVAGTLEAGIEIDLLRDQPFGIAVGYDFFQSLHQDLKAFDLQTHEPHIEIYDFFDPLRPVLAYRYRRDSYGGEDYLASHSVDLDLTHCPWRNTCALLGGEFEKLNFAPSPERDSNRYSLFIGQQTFLWEGFLAFSLGWEPQWQDARANNFDYQAQIVRIGATAFLDQFRKGLVLGASYEFESRDYDHEDPLWGFARRDDRTVFWVGTAMPLIGPTQASFDYIRIESRSNVRQLSYDENIVSLKLWAWR